jgi:hypothetical protein
MFTMKKGGKEVGPASVYAKPHTGSSPKVELDNGYGKKKKGDQLDEMVVSVNAVKSKPYPETKTSGIKMRGAGAATKGVMCRGPMA